MRLFRRLFQRIFNPDDQARSSHKRFIVAFNSGACFCVLGHLWFIFAFLMADAPILAVVNVFSTALWIYLTFFSYRSLKRALYLGVSEIALHAALASLLVGWHTAFNLFNFGFALILFLAPREFLKQKIILFLIICANYFGCFALQLTIAPYYRISEFWQNFFVVQNSVILILALAMIGAYYSYVADSFEDALSLEYERSERVLRNLVPDHIAARLKSGSGLIADAVPQAHILFADLVGFTEFAGRTDPKRLVDLLNELFSEFDLLTSRYGLEKIKTIGDAYMVAGGLTGSVKESASAMADFALAMLTALEAFNRKHQIDWNLRIGIHSGPVIAGVIGHSKSTYDLWGDTVNLASRLEAMGIKGRIHISEAYHQWIGEEFECSGVKSVNLQPDDYRQRLQATCYLLKRRLKVNLAS
jgi:class 3 adenylate cyclase